jgi:hypothetical protein
LKLLESPDLKEINLDGIHEFDQLTGIEISINSDNIKEIDITPLANHPELSSVTIGCPVKEIKGLEALKAIPNLQAVGFYSLDVSDIDLTQLSECKKLEILNMGDLGPENPSAPYRITLPKNPSLKVIEISECFSEDLQVEIDFSFLKSLESLDSFSLVNCNLTSFDFSTISSLKRIGKIDLTSNKITHLDITPIIDMPMFTEKALGEPPFVVDENVIIQIAKNREQDVIDIIGQSDRIVDDHKGSFAIEYEFGHKWLKNLLDTNKVEWI